MHWRHRENGGLSNKFMTLRVEMRCANVYRIRDTTIIPPPCANKRESGYEGFGAAQEKSHLFRVVEPFM
jgi:hypothetical protein